MDFLIRQATPEDAEALVHMHTLAHEETYGDRLSAEFFRTRRASIPERVERRRPYLAGSDPRIIAVDVNNGVVGLADSGPGRDEDGPEALELYSLYTLRRTHGSGLGAALLCAAIGESPAYLWVLENNPRAQAFYVKHGFRFDGGRGQLPPKWEELPEIRMVRPARGEQ
ncbi:GNAT family N-acetyltransferase [Pseudarthrobacter sp. NBSH8]|uniref:GNAT family N-acetyltransferase n=1 Tax=Pseudarthrobacter sp. NBSH8 TaxID=2596911 RepID=UPI0016279E6D|nr:GNAT family N-acetyltransferase [Pseudarthrobacter sp. NBSH8]QNE13736.1 GNAT family N-acetyltransferase [Pseudarthrobacter sp. NBSH8]